MTQSNKSKSNTGKQRMASIMNKDDVNALTHLSAEEKARGISALTRIPLNPAWGILGNDPDLQRLMHMQLTGLLSLLAPDSQFCPHSPMSLIAIDVSRRYGCEWQLSALSEIANENSKSKEWNPDNFHGSMLALLDYPDSKLWNEEQRLTLRLVSATLNNEWTDELVKEARLIRTSFLCRGVYLAVSCMSRIFGPQDIGDGSSERIGTVLRASSFYDLIP